MAEIGPVGLLLIIVNAVFSYKGLNSESFFCKYKFEIDSILINKDYKRLVTSGFLHVNWMHLIFNVLSLYAFSGLLEFKLGSLYFALIYFASLVGGNLLALFIHRNHWDYSSAGASGAVCGIIFASIALFPGLGIGFFGLPVSIPSWLYGILFTAYSIYGIKSAKDNIGHEAHLGGAVTGMLIAVILQPYSLKENYLPILITIIPMVLFIYMIASKPHLLMVSSNLSRKRLSYHDIDQKYMEEKRSRQEDLDRLLDKISKKGINSLSKREKLKLDQLSK